MNTRVSMYFFYFIVSVVGITVNNVGDHQLKTDEKIELSPLFISCGLYDIIIVSAPIINNSTKYYLYKPNGQVIRLYIQPNIQNKNVSSDDYNDIQIKYFKPNVRIITPTNKFRIFNVNYGNSIFDQTDIFSDKEESMNGNDFMIGPLNMDDHGNWVLSAFYQTQNAKWIEVFQVISIQILEIIPAKPQNSILSVGDDLRISFAYTIKDLTSCEITAPRSTFDRFYDRSRHDFQACEFFIPNMTREDAGLWRIIGVGKIIYEATSFITIKDKFL